MSKKKPTKKPKKPRRRGQIDLNRKPAKPKKRPGRKPAKGKKQTGKREKNNAGWWQSCRKEVVEYYKKEYKSDKPLNKEFVKQKTDAVFEVLKASANRKADKKITEHLFGQTIRLLEDILKKPTIEILDPEKVTNEGEGFEWWLIEEFLYNERELVEAYDEIVVDTNQIIDRVPDTGTVPEEIPTTDILRDIRNHTGNVDKKTDSQYIWFHIYKSVDGKQIQFILLDNEPKRLIEVVQEGLGPGGKEGIKQKIMDKDKEKKKPEPGKTEEPAPPTQLPPTQTPIDPRLVSAQAKEYEIKNLNAKKQSFMESIKFYQEQYDRYDKLVKIYRAAGIEHKKELAKRNEFEQEIEELYAKIKRVNKQLEDL